RSRYGPVLPETRYKHIHVGSAEAILGLRRSREALGRTRRSIHCDTETLRLSACKHTDHRSLICELRIAGEF
ncbi:MAG: hypothetical protein V7754_03470, partial [Halioglobus sp.]